MARDWQSLNEYRLFCRGRLADPYPLYHQLRSEDPVHWSERANSWILTRFDDVRFALQHDPRLTAERLSLLLAQLPRKVQAEVKPLRQLLSTWMQGMPALRRPHPTHFPGGDNRLRTARQDTAPGTAHLGYAGRRQPRPATVPQT